MGSGDCLLNYEIDWSMKLNMHLLITKLRMVEFYQGEGIAFSFHVLRLILCHYVSAPNMRFTVFFQLYESFCSKEKNIFLGFVCRRYLVDYLLICAVLTVSPA